MEEFISVSEIEMMRARGGFVDVKNMYIVVAPYGVNPHLDYVPQPPYGVEPPYIFKPQPPYGVVHPPF